MTAIYIFYLFLYPTQLLKSLHSGFIFVINSSFHFRLLPLIYFSKSMASSIESKVLKYTSLLRLYFAEKLLGFCFVKYSHRRVRRSFVTPTYNVVWWTDRKSTRLNSSHVKISYP